MGIFIVLLAATGYILVTGIMIYEAGRDAKREEEALQSATAEPASQGFENLEIPAFLRREPTTQS